MSELETNNELELNSIGNFLNQDILSRAIEHASCIISRTEELERDLFSLPFCIQNLDWINFCNNNDNISVAGANFEKEVCEDQIVLYETKSVEGKSRLIISDPNHQIPNLENPDLSEIYTKSDKQINNKGLIINQMKSNMGFIAYIPFLTGKKIVGIYIRSNGHNQFYYVGTFRTDISIPNISIDSNIVPRSVRGNLTETDKVIISNASPRFRNQLSGFYYVKDAIQYINSLMSNTIDPSYLCKLMILNKNLSFPSTPE